MASENRARPPTAPSVLKKRNMSRKPPASNGRDYSMTALDKELSNDASGLLKFSKTKDFSGENVEFLGLVKQWKASWGQMVDGKEQRREVFNAAVELYVTSIDLRTAKYPVNLDSKTYRALTDIFGEAAKYHGNAMTTNPVAPFESTVRICNDDDTYTSRFSQINGAHPVRIDGLAAPTNTPRTSWDYKEYKISLSQRNSNVTIAPCVPNDFPIPDAFNEAVFDEAAEAIRLLILHDTWPKYVDYNAEVALGNQGTASSREKQSRASRLSRLFKKLM